MNVIKNRFVRWSFALTILLVGVALSFLAAIWLQSVLGLPSFIIKSRSGSPSDLVTLAVALPLVIAYLYAVPKLIRVDFDALSRMLRGE